MIIGTCCQCGREVGWCGIDRTRCSAHELTCDVPGCGAPAYLFSPTGQVCQHHRPQNEPGEPYPSLAAIAAAVGSGMEEDARIV